MLGDWSIFFLLHEMQRDMKKLLLLLLLLLLFFCYLWAEIDFLELIGSPTFSDKC
jgi:hypothetical protein